jgi:hypothetical protein
MVQGPWSRVRRRRSGISSSQLAVRGASGRCDLQQVHPGEQCGDLPRFTRVNVAQASGDPPTGGSRTSSPPTPGWTHHEHAQMDFAWHRGGRCRRRSPIEGLHPAPALLLGALRTGGEGLVQHKAMDAGIIVPFPDPRGDLSPALCSSEIVMQVKILINQKSLAKPSVSISAIAFRSCERRALRRGTAGSPIVLQLLTPEMTKTSGLRGDANHLRRMLAKFNGSNAGGSLKLQ